LHGETKAAGRVTLFNCAQFNCQSSNRLNPPEARVELILRPVQAWCGGDFVDARERYKDLRFRVPGLHNILTTIHIDQQFLVKSKPRQKSPTHQLQKITKAAWESLKAKTSKDELAAAYEDLNIRDDDDDKSPDGK
jgi:hypothetical protein